MRPRLLKAALKRWAFYGPTSSRTKHYVDFPLVRLLSRPMRRERERVKAFFECILSTDLRAVHLVSSSRSGTHAFGTHFHFLPCVFVFAENLFNKTPHRDPLSNHPQALHPIDFLLGSCFREFGLQDKRGEALTHLFYMHNKRVPEPAEADSSAFRETYFVYYFRNPLRTLVSRKKAAARGKRAWDLDLAGVRAFLESERERFRLAREHQAREPQRVTLGLHECYAADPNGEFGRVAEFCGIDASCRAAEIAPRAFFNRCFACEESLTVSDGFLHCTRHGRRIVGAGGGYNPLIEPSLDRALADDLRTALNEAEVAVAREVFPAASVDFWLDDTPKTYKGISAYDALRAFMPV